MTHLIQIAHNATTARLVNPSEDVKTLVQHALSYQVAGTQHMPGFSSNGWDGRSSFLHWDTGAFPRGFVQLVQQNLQQQGLTVQIMRKPFPEPLGPLHPKVDDFPEEERYDYQPRVVDLLLRHGQIIAHCATGSGKSRIAKLAFARIARPALFLTTRSILMYQMGRQFEEMGRKVGIMGDNEFSPKKGINCGMVQTIQARLKDPKTVERMRQILEMFELVILEEAHEISGDGYFDILSLCTNAHYRLALTGTPFMKGDEEANMRLMAASGFVAITVSEKMLIERGILAKPYFKYIQLNKTPDKLYRSTGWQRAVELGIIGNDLRNRHIVAEAIRANSYGLSTMVLVQRKEHGKVLDEAFTRNGLRSLYIFGDSDQAQRQHALNQLKTGAIDVLIGSTILDVGVDVPAIGMVILAGGGKAEVALRQRIGRGLREKKDGSPNVCFVIDFEDPLNTHLRDHSAQRRLIVQTTPGFAEGIVHDFDYQGLGFTKRALAA